MPDDPFGDAFGPLGPLVGRLLGDLGSLDLGDLRPPPGARGTHGLNRFGRDLTADARAGLLDPVIGRDDEIDQVIEVLARRTKNNPVLLGDPGRRQDRDRRGHRPAHRRRRGARPRCARCGWSRWTSRAWSRAPSTAASSRSGSPG